MLNNRQMLTVQCRTLGIQQFLNRRLWGKTVYRDGPGRGARLAAGTQADWVGRDQGVVCGVDLRTAEVAGKMLAGSHVIARTAFPCVSCREGSPGLSPREHEQS